MPFFGFVLILVIFQYIYKNPKKSFHKAIDYSTILFIISVYFLMETIWGKSFFWLILLVLIVTAMFFVIIHWKVKEEVIIHKVLKGFWRFTFLMFFVVYISLTLFGLIHRALVFSLS
ncbi:MULTISPECIES: DUF3397 domain-containing protein [Bacillaceae]|uniref:DUF3397 domain-containing protein n=1 Tax=Bacillaceae TaxID=186817 RepID=UPI00300081B4